MSSGHGDQGTVFDKLRVRRVLPTDSRSAESANEQDQIFVRVRKSSQGENANKPETRHRETVRLSAIVRPSDRGGRRLKRFDAIVLPQRV